MDSDWVVAVLSNVVHVVMGLISKLISHICHYEWFFAIVGFRIKL